MEETLFFILFFGSLIPFNVAENSTTGSNTGATIIPKAQFDENDVVDRLDRIFNKINNEGDPKPLKAAKAYEVIDLLTSISNDQRQKVRDCYDKKHPDKVLTDMVHGFFKKREGQNIANNMKEILRTPGEFLARRIYDTIALEKIESTYLFILCAASVEEIKAIIDFYPKIAGTPLKKIISDLFGDTTGLKKFLLSVTDTDSPRKNGLADDATTKTYIRAIPNSPINCKDTPMLELCATQSFEEIKLVAAAYNNTANRLHDYCAEDLNHALYQTVRFAQDKFKYFADTVKEWLKDTTDSQDKVRSAGPLVVIWRAEIDLAHIIKAYDGDMLADFQSKMSKTPKNLFLMKKLIEGNRGKV